MQYWHRESLEQEICRYSGYALIVSQCSLRTRLRSTAEDWKVLGKPSTCTRQFICMHAQQELTNPWPNVDASVCYRVLLHNCLCLLGQTHTANENIGRRGACCFSSDKPSGTTRLYLSKVARIYCTYTASKPRLGKGYDELALSITPVGRFGPTNLAGQASNELRR